MLGKAMVGLWRWQKAHVVLVDFDKFRQTNFTTFRQTSHAYQPPPLFPPKLSADLPPAHAQEDSKANQKSSKSSAQPDIWFGFFSQKAWIGWVGRGGDCAGMRACMRALLHVFLTWSM